MSESEGVRRLRRHAQAAQAIRNQEGLQAPVCGRRSGGGIPQAKGATMSDTPRTESEVNRQKCWSDDLVTIDANFACQLERELNAANAEIEEKRKDVVWLATEKAKLENYV
ncbi:MAG: hypothetical protein ACK55Z_34005, partial [bacterium]